MAPQVFDEVMRFIQTALAPVPPTPKEIEQ